MLLLGHVTSSYTIAKRTFETMIFRLAQVLGSIISFLGMHCQCSLYVFLLDLHMRFSHRALDLRNDPLIFVRNDYTERVKIQRNHTNNAPQKMK